jgi:hypothetical protein
MAEQLISMIENVKMLNNNLLQQASVLIQANYNQAEIANGGVFTTEIPQVNSQFINEVSLQYEQQGVVAIESYYPSLMVLANQCPYQGGNAVYRARYFISLINDSLEYNDDLNCLGAGIWRNSNTSNVMQLGMNVIPNPTSGNFKLAFSSPLKEKFQLLIVDVNGKDVLKSTITIDGREFEINVGNLISGIYQVQLIGDNSGVFNERLTILK